MAFPSMDPARLVEGDTTDKFEAITLLDGEVKFETSIDGNTTTMSIISKEGESISLEMPTSEVNSMIDSISMNSYPSVEVALDLLNQKRSEFARVKQKTPEA